MTAVASAAAVCNLLLKLFQRKRRRNRLIQQRLIPEQYRIISGSALKLIAVITMLIDHTASALLRDSDIVLITFGDKPLTLYYSMRFVGRIAFPIFAFLLAEGFVYTRNRVKYGVSLAVLALISELPWNLVHTGTAFYSMQNVMFTLLIGYLAMCAMEYLKDNAFALVASIGALTAASFVLRFDYGSQGFCFIILMYLLRGLPVARAAAGICVLPSRWVGGFAFLPIAFYSGKRGFIKGKALKYAFYAFYPVHLLVLYFIKYFIFGR